MTDAIPSVADVSAFQQGQLAQQVSIAVAAKTLDAAKAQGQAVLSLLTSAVELQQQALPTEPGKGRHVDVQG